MTKHPNGAVLVIVLWVLAILSAIGVGLSYRAGLEAKRSGAMNGKVQSVALCQAAIARMNFELTRDTNGYDALSDPWGNNKDLFDRYRLETGTYTISHGSPTILFGATDEESRIAVNTASKEVLERLFKSVDAPADLAEAVLDWIDADSNTRFHGAEAYEYASQTRPYAPRNGKIPLLEELLLVKGITPDIYAKIAPLLTVYGDGKVNINTAGGPVLEILGFPADLVEKIVRYRRGLDDQEGTGDDGVFRMLDRVSENLQATETITNADRYLLNNFTGQLTVGSRFFRMQVQGVSNGGIITRVTAVVERMAVGQQIPPKILCWKEQ